MVPTVLNVLTAVEDGAHCTNGLTAVEDGAHCTNGLTTVDGAHCSNGLTAMEDGAHGTNGLVSVEDGAHCTHGKRKHTAVQEKSTAACLQITQQHGHKLVILFLFVRHNLLLRTPFSLCARFTLVFRLAHLCHAALCNLSCIHH